MTTSKDIDELRFGLGIQVKVLNDQICEIDPWHENMPKCLLPGDGGQIEDDVCPLTSNDQCVDFQGLKFPYQNIFQKV